MSLKREKNSLLVFVILLVGSTIALIAWIKSWQKKKDPEKWLRRNLQGQGFTSKCVDLWVALSKLESDDYKSTLAVKYFNVVGMTVPKQRPSLKSGQVYSEGDDQYFSVYANFDKCAADLVLWCIYTEFPQEVDSVDGFVMEIKKRGYFTSDPDAYARGLQEKLKG
jgi:hypothetical protein